MKMAQADLYNELNLVLKKRNQMTRRSSILELERQKGCKTIVYYGRGGSPSGQLIRKGSITSSSPSPLAGCRGPRIRRESNISRSDSLGSDFIPGYDPRHLDPRHLTPAESPLCKDTDSLQEDIRHETPISREKVQARIEEISNRNSLDLTNVSSTSSEKPQIPWPPPPPLIRLDKSPGNHLDEPDGTNKVNRRSLGDPDATIRTSVEDVRRMMIRDELGKSRVMDKHAIHSDSSDVNPVEARPASSTVLGDERLLFQTDKVCSVVKTGSGSTADASETDSIVTQELNELRKTFDRVDLRKTVPIPRVRNHVPPAAPPISRSVESIADTGSKSKTLDPAIRVEIQWPARRAPSSLQDELMQWHERLSGKWKNQDEEDMMEMEFGEESSIAKAIGEEGLYQSNGHQGVAARRSESDRVGQSGEPKVQLPRAALSPSTRQRLRDIKLQASNSLFAKRQEAKTIHSEDLGNGTQPTTQFSPTGRHRRNYDQLDGHDDPPAGKHRRNYDQLDGHEDLEVEEKEGSIEFTEEMHPGSLVSQLVEKVARDYSVHGWPGNQANNNYGNNQHKQEAVVSKATYEPISNHGVVMTSAGGTTGHLNDVATVAAQISDVSSDLTPDGSTAGHQMENTVMTNLDSSSSIPPPPLPPPYGMTSDVSLTTVTSYEVSTGDLREGKYRPLGAVLSSSETLANSNSMNSSAADMRYTSGDSMNAPHTSEPITSQDDSMDSQRGFMKSTGSVIDSSKSPGFLLKNRLNPGLGEKHTYAGASTLEGQQRFVDSKQPIFVKVIPTLIDREPSQGLHDSGVNSLDRLLYKRARNVLHQKKSPSHGHLTHTGGSEGNSYSTYATYPPASSQNRPFEAEDDALTNLIITHSGDPMPPDLATSLHSKSGSSTGESRQNCISAMVTVPQPTSFHQHGNNVGGHLINPRHGDLDGHLNGGSLLADSDQGTDGFHISSSCTEYESANENAPVDHVTDHMTGALNDPSRHLLAGDSESGEDGPHGARYQRKHVALDKESQRHLLFQTWSSNAAKKVRDRSKLPHWRRGIRSARPGEDSDSSLGPKHSKSDGAICDRRGHYIDHRLNDSHTSHRSGRGDRSGRSMQVKSRLLSRGHRHDSFSSCDAPCGEMGVYHSRPESIHSAATYFASEVGSDYLASDSAEHSSDADTESLYQDYEQYEQSLIQYVRTEDLSQINEDIRSLYWQQFDSMSLTLPGTHRGLLHRLVCCFFCDNAHHTSIPTRPESRASSSKYTIQTRSY